MPQSATSPIDSLPRSASPANNEDLMKSKEKNVDFYCISTGKYFFLGLLIVVFSCLAVIICREIIYNNKVQSILITQLGNSFAAIFVSLATFFGLKNKN